MTKRIPGSERTREALNGLMDGRLRVENARSDLVKLATRLIIEEGLEAEVRDALGRDYYEHGRGGGHRNGVREGRMKTAEGFVPYSAPQVAGGEEPFRSELRQHLKGAREYLKLIPDFSIAAWAKTECYTDPTELQRYVDGLRKAGFPE